VNQPKTPSPLDLALILQDVAMRMDQYFLTWMLRMFGYRPRISIRNGISGLVIPVNPIGCFLFVTPTLTTEEGISKWFNTVEFEHLPEGKSELDTFNGVIEVYIPGENGSEIVFTHTAEDQNMCIAFAIARSEASKEAGFKILIPNPPSKRLKGQG